MSERQAQSEIYLEHVLMVHAVSKRSGVGFATAMIQALSPWLKAQELTERERLIVADGELACRTDPKAEKKAAPEFVYAVRGPFLSRSYVRGRNVARQSTTVEACHALIDAAERCGSIGFYRAKLVGLCQSHPRAGVAFAFLQLVGAFVPHASGQGFAFSPRPRRAGQARRGDRGSSRGHAVIDLRFRPLESPLPRPKSGRWLAPQYLVAWPRLLDDLEVELRHIGANDVNVEADFQREQIRMDGWPRGSASPASPGIRLSFRSAKAGGERSIAVNRFADWKQNLRAISLVLQRLRLVAEIDPEQGTRAYAGYAKLPPPPPADGEFESKEAAARFLLKMAGHDSDNTGNVREVLNGQLKVAYRAAAQRCHPDSGGSEALMRRVNAAKDFIEQNA